MTKKQKGWTIFGIVAGGLVVVVYIVVILGLMGVFPMLSSKRNVLLKEFSREECEEILHVKICEGGRLYGTSNYQNGYEIYNGEGYITCVIDSFAYLDRYGVDRTYGYHDDHQHSRYYSNRFWITPHNLAVLQDNGFFEDIEIGMELEITVSPYTFVRGNDNISDIPVYAISCGDKVYLDRETGRQNHLDWIENDLR